MQNVQPLYRLRSIEKKNFVTKVLPKAKVLFKSRLKDGTFCTYYQGTGKRPAVYLTSETHVFKFNTIGEAVKFRCQLDNAEFTKWYPCLFGPLYDYSFGGKREIKLDTYIVRQAEIYNSILQDPKRSTTIGGPTKLADGTTAQQFLIFGGGGCVVRAGDKIYKWENKGLHKESEYAIVLALEYSFKNAAKKQTGRICERCNRHCQCRIKDMSLDDVSNFCLWLPPTAKQVTRLEMEGLKQLTPSAIINATYSPIQNI
jgi:hypothetical protein